MHTKDKCKLILAGDFNLPDINWNNIHEVGNEGERPRSLLNMSFSHDLTQVVKCYTKTRGNGESLLDLIFLSTPLADKEYSCQVIDGTSDYDLAFFACPLLKNKPTFCVVQKVLNFGKTTDVGIMDYLDEYSK